MGREHVRRPRPTKPRGNPSQNEVTTNRGALVTTGHQKATKKSSIHSQIAAFWLCEREFQNAFSFGLLQPNEGQMRYKRFIY